MNLYWWHPNGAGWVKISSLNDDSGIYKWNKKLKKVSFYIDHFSIYAFSKD
jgi:hypothetical protein